MRSTVRYRDLAAHMRRLAQSVDDPDLRGQLELSAVEYDAMAEEIEGEISDESPPS
jgi:hypothetical protein